ncbi:Hypothetical predicted protein [Marmota monax]|uniref:Uncharacterized protein n=1 Tax=Marmota monax TaxID=9995 RepID=A0A5E4AFQ3_MARMO|nr:hypothetical protein GHT09_016141 [Marmota monax]VTJ56167.1 Hypothetical predicted protein [Marmota monax]
MLGIQASDIQCLLTLVEWRLNENLTLSHKEKPFSFSLDRPEDDELEIIAKKTLLPSEPKKTTELKKRKRHIEAKSRILVFKKALRVARKHKKIEFKKISSVSVPSEDEGEQSEARESGQIDTQDAALESELPPSAYSPVKPQEDAETKEVMLEAMEAKEAPEVTETSGTMDQYSMKDCGGVIPKLERHKRIKRFWKRSVKKGQRIAKMKWEERREEQPIITNDISEMSIKEPKEEVTEVSKLEEGTRKKPGQRRHGLAGAPGHAIQSDTRSWRDDICYLGTLRIDLSTLSPELDEGEVEEPPIITEKEVKREVKNEEMVVFREQEATYVLKKDAKFSPEDKEKGSCFLRRSSKEI